MYEISPGPPHPQVLREERTDTGYRLHLQVPEDLYYLNGHFSQVPIVAGVCQLKWVIDYIQGYTGETLHLNAMEDVRFQRPLFPNKPFVIELAYIPHLKTWQYEVFAEDQRFASGRLVVAS